MPRVPPVMTTTGLLGCSSDTIKHPTVVKEPIYGAQDAFFNGEPRLPSSRSDSGSIKKDKWVIADPSSVPTRLDNLRLQVHRCAYPRRRIIHRTEIVNAEIVKGQSLVGFQLQNNRVNAIGNMQVALALTPIPKHGELIRVMDELTNEVNHMAVCVARAENRNKSKYCGVNKSCLSISTNHAFRGHL